MRPRAAAVLSLVAVSALTSMELSACGGEQFSTAEPDASGSGGAGTRECDSDSDCDGERCQPLTGACEECFLDDHCEAGDRCGAGRCEPACESDADCAGRSGRTACDTSGHCLGCLGAGDCGDSELCRDGQCIGFTPCQNSASCPAETLCDEALGRCVECVRDAGCTAEQRCVASTCETRCDGDSDCTVPKRVCDGGQGVCVECLDTADCPEAAYCAGGRCRIDVCIGGTSRCNSGVVVVCNEAGSSFETEEACESRQTCVSSDAGGHCEDWVCTPNELECEDDRTATRCSADGLSVVERVDCSETDGFCVSGECRDSLCEPDAVFCQGRAVRRCDATGMSTTVVTECLASEYCDPVQGECVPQVCVPGTAACDGENRVVTCNPEGSARTVTEDCRTGTCSAGLCAASLFAADFEDGDLVGWTVVPDGNYMLEVTTDTAAAGSARSLEMTGGTGFDFTGIYRVLDAVQPARASFWARSDSANANTFFALRGSDLVGYVFFSEGQIFAPSGVLVVSLASYDIGQWYRIDLDIDWTSKTIDYSVDGATAATLLPFADTTQTSVSRLDLYHRASATGYFDEIALRDAAEP